MVAKRDRRRLPGPGPLADTDTETEKLWADRDGSSWRVSVRWSTIAGRMEPVAVYIEAPPGRSLTGEVVRRVPVGTIVAEARRRNAQSQRAVVQALGRPENAGHGVDADNVRAVAELFDARARRTWDDSHLRAVAEVYREAWIEGGHPTLAVAEHFNVARSTAAKLVRAARDRQLLGESVAGRAGEEQS